MDSIKCFPFDSRMDLATPATTSLLLKCNNNNNISEKQSDRGTFDVRKHMSDTINSNTKTVTQKDRLVHHNFNIRRHDRIQMENANFSTSCDQWSREAWWTWHSITDLHNNRKKINKGATAAAHYRMQSPNFKHPLVSCKQAEDDGIDRNNVGGSIPEQVRLKNNSHSGLVTDQASIGLVQQSHQALLRTTPNGSVEEFLNKSSPGLDQGRCENLISGQQSVMISDYQGLIPDHNHIRSSADEQSKVSCRQKCLNDQKNRMNGIEIMTNRRKSQSHNGSSALKSIIISSSGSSSSRSDGKISSSSSSASTTITTTNTNSNYIIFKQCICDTIVSLSDKRKIFNEFRNSRRNDKKLTGNRMKIGATIGKLGWYHNRNPLWILMHIIDGINLPLLLHTLTAIIIFAQIFIAIPVVYGSTSSNSLLLSNQTIYLASSSALLSAPGGGSGPGGGPGGGGGDNENEGAGVRASRSGSGIGDGRGNDDDDDDDDEAGQSDDISSDGADYGGIGDGGGGSTRPLMNLNVAAAAARNLYNNYHGHGSGQQPPSSVASSRTTSSSSLYHHHHNQGGRDNTIRREMGYGSSESDHHASDAPGGAGGDNSPSDTLPGGGGNDGFGNTRLTHGGCYTCQMLQQVKADNLASIKRHILMRLEMKTTPNITSPIVPREIIEKFYKNHSIFGTSIGHSNNSRNNLNRNNTNGDSGDDGSDDINQNNNGDHMQGDDPRSYQSDTNTNRNRYHHTSSEQFDMDATNIDTDDEEYEEEFFSVMKSVYVFPTIPRMRHLRKPDIFHFALTNNGHSMISQAILHIYIRGRDWMREHDPNNGSHLNGRHEITLTINRVLRRQNSADSTHTQKINEIKHLIPNGVGAWVTVNVTDLVTSWFNNPNSNHGIVIKTPDNWMKSYIVIDDNPSNKAYTLYIEVLTKDNRKRRTKRNTSLNCSESDNEERCCRYPLEVDFRKFNWDWIIAPTSFNAYFCNGECKLGFLPKYPHTHIMQLSTAPQPCCSPTKMSPISLLYFNNEHNLVMSTIPNMAVDECSCS